MTARSDGTRPPVVVAGHICVDLHPGFDGEASIQPGMLLEVGPLRVRSGGCVANTGLDLASLGTPVRLFADVGDDELGRMLREVLRGPNVDASGVLSVGGEQTSYSIVIQQSGEDRCFWHHVGANQHYDASSVDFEGTDLMHLGYPTILPALYQDDGRRLLAVLERARSAGVTTSVDLSTVGPGSPAAGAGWDRILDRALPLIDVFGPSLDDLASVSPGGAGAEPHDVSRLGSSLIDAGAAIVLLKAGGAGLYLRSAGAGRLRSGGRALQELAHTWADRELWAPSMQVGVRGTTGAGDAASAGLLHALSAGLGPQEAVTLASAAAACRISAAGSLPSADELIARIGGDLVFGHVDMDGWRPAGGGLLSGPHDGSHRARR